MKIVKLLQHICVVVVILTCLFTPVPAEAQGNSFQDAFDDPNLPGWEHSSQAEVVDGVLQMRPGGFAMHPGNWKNISLTINLRISGQGRAFLGYYTSEAGNYVLRLGEGVLILEKEQNKSRTVLEEVQLETRQDTWITVKIVVNNDQHDVFIDGVLQLSTVDTESLEKGGVILSVDGEAIVEYDDLSVSGTLIEGALTEEHPPSANEASNLAGVTQSVPSSSEGMPSPSGINALISEFFASQASTFDLTTFMINIMLAVICSYLLGLVYTHWGSSLSNRRKFAANFMLMAVTTTFIILVVRSSVALSLGLVGALSIVRFRTAVKEPEELAYLFVAVGIGIGLGDNQRLITLVALAAIILIIGLRRLFRKTEADVNLHLSISSHDKDKVDLNQVKEALNPHVSKMRLLRMDESKHAFDASFLVEFTGGSDLSRATAALKELSPGIEITYMDNKGIW